MYEVFAIFMDFSILWYCVKTTLPVDHIIKCAVIYKLKSKSLNRVNAGLMAKFAIVYHNVQQ